ncbi:MAG: tyrosine-type recombinase/integrase, partial [Chromatocurvus sp.]
MALTPREVEAATHRGLYGDGDGLYLSIAKGGSKSWIYRYQMDGRRRYLGLGGYPAISLAQARIRRDEARKLVRLQGIDPLEARHQQKATAVAELQASAEREQRAANTFKVVAENYIEQQASGWSNRKHAQQWRNTLSQHAYPHIGDRPVHKVTTEDVLSVLSPIWTEKTETAKRVQGRIERILDYAITTKLRDDANPARWRGHLDVILPKPGKVRRVEHQRALPYAQAPALAAELQKLDTPAGRALILTLLCATRTSESLEARWSEIDLERAEWRIPASRMKAGKEHRIPLPEAATAILRAQEAIRRDDWVFAGQKRGHSLSNMAMTNVLKRIGWLDHTTVHGLRSTFRDWAGEKTRYPERMAEVALAHQLTDKVQA